MKRTRLLAWIASALLAMACDRNPPAEENRAPIELRGAGATFPYPLYSKWIAEYRRIDPRIWIDYQPVGSGEGIEQFLAGSVDFGASDAPLSDADLNRAGFPLVHIPTAAGAVALVYEPSALRGALKLTPEVLVEIFLGRITGWRDPRLMRLNPDLALPATPIHVVHRSDGSGTTAMFTAYLATVSAEWKSRVGDGLTVSWPVGSGARGNEGVGGLVKTTPGAIGFVELAYATRMNLGVASLRNRAGVFVAPTVGTTAQAAAESVATVPKDLRAIIVDAKGANSYPIVNFTYVLLRRNAEPTERRHALTRFLSWALRDGQRFAAPLDYAPLPAPIVTRAEALLHGLDAR